MVLNIQGIPEFKKSLFLDMFFVVREYQFATLHGSNENIAIYNVHWV